MVQRLPLVSLPRPAVVPPPRHRARALDPTAPPRRRGPAQGAAEGQVREGQAVRDPGARQGEVPEEGRLVDGPDGDAVRQQSPLGRVAKPEEVAHAVLSLASEGAAFSTGTIIDVNGASYLRS